VSALQQVSFISPGYLKLVWGRIVDLVTEGKESIFTGAAGSGYFCIVILKKDQ
jgi:hypothetical protein